MVRLFDASGLLNAEIEYKALNGDVRLCSQLVVFILCSTVHTLKAAPKVCLEIKESTATALWLCLVTVTSATSQGPSPHLNHQLHTALPQTGLTSEILVHSVGIVEALHLILFWL